MIALSDDELSAVMDAGRPIPPPDRDLFLQALADELAQHPGEVGAGLIHRIARDLQRRFFTPPDLSGCSKYLAKQVLMGITPDFRGHAKLD